MTNNIERIIKNVEAKWLTNLQMACEKQFADCHLPSHDAAHHLRVWKYARHLLKHFPETYPIHEEFVEQLIVAVFFHDQGMSITPSKDHGKISRHLCKAYFETNQIPTFPHFDSVLNAIENHDQKDYSLTITDENRLNLIQTLNIADDLDAFGIVGAYRYLEIYLMRKIAIPDLPEAVLTNINKRFIHFSSVFQFDKRMVKSQNQRYIAARNFYKDLNMQMKQLGYSPEILNGPIGIANFISKWIIGNKMDLKEATTYAISLSPDFYFSNFFEKLAKEI